MPLFAAVLVVLRRQRGTEIRALPYAVVPPWPIAVANAAETIGALRNRLGRS